jgi:hypothetical protein
MSSASRKRSGIVLFPSSTARSSSFRHSGETTESGLITKMNESAASIPDPSSRRHGAAGGMSSASIQTFRPSLSNALFSSKTKSRSRCE